MHKELIERLEREAEHRRKPVEGSEFVPLADKRVADLLDQAAAALRDYHEAKRYMVVMPDKANEGIITDDEDDAAHASDGFRRGFASSVIVEAFREGYGDEDELDLDSDEGPEFPIRTFIEVKANG